MKLTIDTSNKTIELHEDVKILDLIDEIEGVIKGDWREFKIKCFGSKIEYLPPFPTSQPNNIPFIQPNLPWIDPLWVPYIPINPPWIITCSTDNIDYYSSSKKCTCKRHD